jgi:ubiquinone/menaquinone biosynthesis C-methylase UbiE
VTRWPQGEGARYAARFRSLAESGVEVHGEARFCAALVPPGARVLDAGCGTGRVAVELARRGYDCVGVDVDDSMLAEARRAAPELTWVACDLAALTPELVGGRPFDLVVCAGNVVPLVATGTEPAVVEAMSEVLRPGGLLVVGFGLDRAHLPASAARVRLEDYDRWCTDVGLVPEARYATWDADPWPGDGGYAVTVHRRR